MGLNVINGGACPDCGGLDIELRSGDGMRIKELEVD